MLGKSTWGHDGSGHGSSFMLTICLRNRHNGQNADLLEISRPIDSCFQLLGLS